MAVLGYNSNPSKEKIELSDGKWTLSIKEVPSTSTNEKAKKKLVVINNSTEEKYIVDGFEKKTKCEFDETDVWYSFDTNSGNFHIVPGKSIEIKVECKNGKEEKITLIDKLGCIKKKLEIAGVHASVPKPTAKTAAVDNHRYVLAKSEKNEYLMSFNRLWCDDSDSDNKTFHIHNNFGQAQFMCYPRADGDINSLPDGFTKRGRIKHKFELMYPRFDEDGKSEGKGRHLVFNAPYDINDDAKEIAKCFSKFIAWCEKLCENNEAAELKNDAEFIKWCDEYGKNI